MQGIEKVILNAEEWGLMNHKHYSSIGLFIPGSGHWVLLFGPGRELNSMSLTQPGGLTESFQRVDTLSAPYIVELEVTKHSQTKKCLNVAPLRTAGTKKAFATLEVSGLEMKATMKGYYSESGLGHTGEVYLVGLDKILRSTSRFVANGSREVLYNEAEAYSGITILLVVDVLPDSLNQMIKTYAYRIIQEALTNIVKHSNASKAVVSVFSDILKLYLHVVYNGAGFNPATQLLNGNRLYNMKERASLLGGKLTIISSPGKV